MDSDEFIRPLGSQLDAVQMVWENTTDYFKIQFVCPTERETPVFQILSDKTEGTGRGEYTKEELLQIILLLLKAQNTSF